MTRRRPEKCLRGNKAKLRFEDFGEVVHRRAERFNLLDELESSVSEEKKRALREEAEVDLNNSAREISRALIDWLLLENELTAYDYEYIQKIGTLLDAIASELRVIAVDKIGVSEETQSIIQQHVGELLREIFLRNC